jgi:IPT/TIG domain
VVKLKLISDFYANAAQVLAILVLALIWDSKYFNKVRTGAFNNRQFWKPPKIRVYSTLVAVVAIGGIAVCLAFLSGLLTNSTQLRVGVRFAVALALITLLFRMITHIWGLDTPRPPTVTGINPTSGLVAGGDTVTVTGSGLAGATAVRFGTAAAAIPAPVSDTHLTVTSPPNPPGTVHVTVTTPAGTSATSAADQFTYK